MILLYLATQLPTVWATRSYEAATEAIVRSFTGDLTHDLRLAAPPSISLLALDCWVFFGQCLFVFQAAFVKFRSSRSTSFGVRYPRAE